MIIVYKFTAVCFFRMKNQLFVYNISLSRPNHQHHPPGVPWNDFWKNKKILTFLKNCWYDFVWLCDVYVSPKYLNSQNIAFPSQVKKISLVCIFFLLLYSYLLYFLCMVRNKDFFAILFWYSCNLVYFEICKY